MKNRIRLTTAIVSVSILIATLVVGCKPSANSASKTKNGAHSDSQHASLPPIHTSDNAPPGGSVTTSAAEKSESTDEEHGHKAGQHGGIMVSLGRDSYHVEAVVDSTGSIRIYTLGKDETRVIDVETQTLKGFVKADGDNDAQSISFEPQPQDGDAEKKTSLFVGKLPDGLAGQRLEVTIPNIRIDGERFRLGFQSGQTAHGEAAEMPDKLAASEEKELYLMPSGRYTAADIAANGNMTATQKFKGIKSSHDMNPKAGDRICPITETKANSKFSWIIDGKSYLFCCPPCVDEFVKMAKVSNDPLPDPESYVKK